MKSGIKIVYNKLLGGWYVVRGPHQTPLAGRFATKAEAQAYLDRGKTPEQELDEAEKTAREVWYAYCDTHELPPDIPRDPDVVYHGRGWKGWRDWIGAFDA